MNSLNSPRPLFVEPQRNQSGFTLPEVMVASAIFSLAVVAMISSHLLGLRMFNITATKLSAAAAARTAVGSLRNDVRGAKTLFVGYGDSTYFTNIPDGALRQGNALQIYPTTDTNTFLRYYVDSATQTLRRIQSDSQQVKLMASYITNQVPFGVEDFTGNTLTNDVNNRVIRMTLDFYQWEFPVAQVGAGAFYDHYRVQTRVTRRAID